LGFSSTRCHPTVARPERGSTITLSRRGFATAVSGLGFEVAIDSQPCLSVAVISNTQLTCKVPPGSVARLEIALTPVVEVTYGGGRTPLVYEIKLATQTVEGFSYTGPTIDRVDPTELPTSGGRLTLFGSSLGAGSVSVTASNALKCRVVSSSVDHVVVAVGPGTGARRSLTLRNRAGLSKAYFSYAAPSIAKIDTNGFAEYSTWPRNDTFTPSRA